MADKNPQETPQDNFLNGSYTYILTHMQASLAGNSVVPSLSNEANDIQHVALFKKLWVVWTGLRDMSLFPMVKLHFCLEPLMRTGNRHRMYSHTIYHKH